MPTTSPITRWSRRHTLLAGAALLSGSARAADAAWPGGPVVIHTPYGAGGTSHNLSGVVAAQMSISLGNEVPAQTPDAVVEAFDRELNAAIGASVVNHVLLAAGAKGKRLALPNAMILIHQPSSGVEGQQTDIQIVADETKWIRQHLNELLSEYTGQPIEKVNADTERDNYLRAAEAAAYGLVDKVISSRIEQSDE